jgi:hypothetical protein
LGTFWLKIEQFWPFEEISIFSNSSHLEWRAGLSDKNLKGTIAALVYVKMSWNFNCSYMARSSLTYIPGFSVKFFFQPIFSSNLGIFWLKIEQFCPFEKKFYF